MHAQSFRLFRVEPVHVKVCNTCKGPGITQGPRIHDHTAGSAGIGVRRHSNLGATEAYRIDMYGKKLIPMEKL